MSTVANEEKTRCLENLNLVSLLSNPLILENTTPFLSLRDRFALGATSKTFHELTNHTSGVFRHLDLSGVKAAQFDIDPIDNGGEVWRNVQVDENLTEDDFYSGPLRGIFSTLQRRDLLKSVQTLVLDGLSVTADFVNEILIDASYNVRILSIRKAVHLNQRKLRGALKYACRPSRPPGMPKLKGLYIFSEPEGWNKADSAQRHGEAWYETKGKILQSPISPEWAETMVDCQGIIAFDAVLCTAPCHFNSAAFGSVPVRQGKTPAQWAVAHFAVPMCESCGSSPEGPTIYNPKAEPGRLPLLTPIPVLGSSLRAATCPSLPGLPSFVPRCMACLEDRYCQSCNKWWCEKCYAPPNNDTSQAGMTPEAVALENEARDNSKVHVSRSCVECGWNCSGCINRTQKRCSSCGTGYCMIHHEGSCSTYCDWCSSNKKVVIKANKPKHHLPQQRPTGQTKEAWLQWMRRQHSAPERAIRSTRQRVVIRDIRCCSPRR